MDHEASGPSDMLRRNNSFISATVRRDSLIVDKTKPLEVRVEKGKRGGLGLGLSDMVLASGETVINCVTYMRTEGPAERCGVALFDRVITVNGSRLSGPLTEELIKDGQEVMLGVERPPHDAAYESLVTALKEQLRDSCHAATRMERESRRSEQRASEGSRDPPAAPLPAPPTQAELVRADSEGDDPMAKSNRRRRRRVQVETSLTEPADTSA